MLQSLDWKTSLPSANIGHHWRVILCAAIGGLIAVIVCSEAFPNVLGFVKLWMGLATGMSVGMIPGTIWQLSSRKRCSITSGWFLLTGIFALGVFGVIAIFLMAPDLSAQERERTAIRSLKAVDINAIAIFSPGKNIRRLENHEAINSFIESSEHAELFYPSHELCGAEIVVAIDRADGVNDRYQGCVPAHHPNDLSLTFHAYFSNAKILIPGGKAWLDKYGTASGIDVVDKIDK